MQYCFEQAETKLSYSGGIGKSATFNTKEAQNDWCW